MSWWSAESNAWKKRFMGAIVGNSRQQVVDGSGW